MDEEELRKLMQSGFEKKAKAYDEALERMKSWVKGEHPECFSEAQKAAEFIFPELKDSKDERIRKALIKYFKNFDSESLYTVGLNEEEILIWLEKQGERKSAWSEEDERILDALITSLNNEVFARRLETLKGIGVSSVIDWLKSIKHS